MWSLNVRILDNRLLLNFRLWLLLRLWLLNEVRYIYNLLHLLLLRLLLVLSILRLLRVLLLSAVWRGLFCWVILCLAVTLLRVLLIIWNNIPHLHMNWLFRWALYSWCLWTTILICLYKWLLRWKSLIRNCMNRIEFDAILRLVNLNGVWWLGIDLHKFFRLWNLDPLRQIVSWISNLDCVLQTTSNRHILRSKNCNDKQCDC